MYSVKGTRGADGNKHFPVPFMIRLNQIERATSSILSCWAFLRDSVFLYFIVTPVFICTVWRQWLINGVVISIVDIV
jgi:hypothetical protein